MRPSLPQRLEQQKMQTVDLSPLLDVVFILLIFFIVTTVFIKDSGVEVSKPQALSASQIPQNVVMLGISAGGDIMHDGVPLGIDGVRSTINQLMQGGQRPVVITADRQVSTALLINVIDEATLGGARSVSVATEKP